MDSVTSLRLRAILESNFEIIAIALVMLVLLGGAGVWAGYVASTTTLESVDQPTGELSGEFAHSATVVNDSAVYEEGAVLENMPRYFTTLTPNATITFRLEYTSDTPLDVDITIYQTLQSEVDGTPVISETQERRTVSTTLEGTEEINESVVVEPREIVMRFAEIRETVGADIGEQHAWIRVHVEAEGPGIVDEEIDLHIDASQERYAFEQDGSLHHEFTETTIQRVEQEPGMLPRIGGPLAVIAGLVGIAALGAARYRNLIALSAGEREYLAFRDDLAEYGEYIVRIDQEVDRLVEADHLGSLADLVTLARAKETLVLEDTSTGRYFVEEDGQLYVFAPPPTV